MYLFEWMLHIEWVSEWKYVSVHCTCLSYFSIISDLGGKLKIDKSVIKDGLSNTKFDESTRISWKHGCSSEFSLKFA